MSLISGDVYLKLNVKQPRKFQDSIEIEEFFVINNIPFDDLQSRVLSEMLILQGYDAIEIGRNQILVIIFDRQQIAIFNVEQI